MSLDERQRLFCERYLLTFNGTQAYKDAGYTAKDDDVAATGAWRLLRKAEVQAYLAELTAKVRERAVVDIATVVEELRRILLTDIADAVDDSGKLRPLKEWPIDLRRAVAGIDNEELWGPSEDGEGREVLGTVRKVRLWSKTDAAQQLLRHLGGFEKDNRQGAPGETTVIILPDNGRGDAGR